MSKTLINSTIILNEALALLHTESAALKFINRQYDDRFAAGGVSGKPGTSLSVRKPVQVTVRSGRAIDLQDTVEESVTINCSTQIGVDLPAFTSEDLTMKVDDFANRYLKPAMARLAGYIDAKICQTGAEDFYSLAGAAGTIPQSMLVWLQAGQKLNELNVPQDKRSAIMNPEAQAYMVDALKALQHPGNTITEQYRSGNMGAMGGLKFSMDQNIYGLTMGSRTGSTLVDYAAGYTTQGMSVVHVDAFGGATQTVKKGEVFTIADVYAVNPETKVQYGHLQQFVVTEDFDASSSEGDISFAPAIYTTGARQNVNSFPVDGKAVTFVGTASATYPMNLVMHEDAITLVTADLVVPRGCHDAARKTMDGVSMRFVTDYDIKSDEFISRFDIYYGITTLDRAKGCKLIGK